MSEFQDDAFTDIANAIMRLRAAFAKHHMNPPKSIELASNKDGTKFRHMISSSLLAPMARFDPDKPANAEIAISLCGVDICYPAVRRQLTSKKSVWQ